MQRKVLNIEHFFKSSFESTIWEIIQPLIELLLNAIGCGSLLDFGICSRADLKTSVSQ